MWKEFQDDEAAYLLWRAQHSDGFILNMNRQPTARYLYLHRAACRTLDQRQQTSGEFTERGYVKVVAEKSAELQLWVDKRFPGIRAHLCGTCKPVVDQIMLEHAREELNRVEADEEEAAIATLPIAMTEKAQLVMARRGQGAFRLNVSKVEIGCRLTGTSDKRFLIASHIKPWSVSDNVERLDGNNGLLLAPHVDRLFDGGWVSFADDGELLTAGPEIDALLVDWGLTEKRQAGSFSDGQRAYLKYHRKTLFASRVHGIA